MGHIMVSEDGMGLRRFSFPPLLMVVNQKSMSTWAVFGVKRI
jgi:hypothetical protein